MGEIQRVFDLEFFVCALCISTDIPPTKGSTWRACLVSFLNRIMTCLNNDLVASMLLLGLTEDVDVPTRLVCMVLGPSKRWLITGLQNVLAVRGILKRLRSLPRALTFWTSSGVSSTSLKLSRMRDGVTDLGMTLWPPTWDQARLEER